jgi:hypothetical protein
MKTKSLLAASALLAIAPMGATLAAPNNVGCGVGTIIFNGQTGVAPQVLAATTNGILGNQTFGISSGTLGCARDGVVQNPVRVSMFINNNMDRLARDMATGQGETLEAMANLIGIDQAHKAAFFSLTKQHFAEIIPSERTNTSDIILALNHVMASDSGLAPYARLI